MDQSKPKNTLFICYPPEDADFAYKLSADLKKIGYDVWLDPYPNSNTTYLPPILEQCSLALPILSNPDHFNEIWWIQLQSRSEGDTFQLIPLRLDDLTITPNQSEDSINFSRWRNEVHYANRRQDLLDLLSEFILPDPKQIPDGESQHINELVSKINRYRSFLEVISPKSDALPNDKRAIYTRSLWGLTGVFQLTSDESTDLSTYQFHDVLDKYPRFVLVGAPGAGKTITLYRALLDTLRAHQANRALTGLPTLVHLGKWVTDESFAEFLSHQRPVTLDEQSKEIIFLDGLDELGETQSHKIDEIAVWLAGLESCIKVVISCSDVYDSQFDLPVVVLNEIDVPRIRQYVVNHIDRPAADKLLNQIIIPEKGETPAQAIRVARRAFLLSILVSHFQTHPDIPVPINEGQLLAWFCHSNWMKYSSTPFDVCFQALSPLAFELIDAGGASFISYDDALNIVGDEQILQTALDCQLLQMDGDLVGFSHLKLRDYFATYTLLNAEGVYTRLTRAQFDDNGQRLNWKWDHVVILCSGLVELADRFVLEIAEVNPYLALECIANGAEVKEKTTEDVIERIMNFTRSIDANYIDKIMNALETVVDADAMPALLEHLYTHTTTKTFASQNVNEDATMPLKKLGNDTVRFLLNVLKGEKWQRRRGAAWALGELQEPVAVPSLVEALTDENESVRQEAIHALVRIGRPAVNRLIRSLKDDNADVRAAVIKTLGRVKDAASVPHLIASLSDNAWPEQEEVRISELAALALEQIGTDDALAAVDNWRNKQDIRDKDWVVRVKRAIKEDKPSNLSHAQLLDQLTEPDWVARRDAVRQLGEAHDPDMLPHILAAASDDDNQVRWTALKALENYDTPEVITVLLNSLSDEDMLVCDTAAQILSTLGERAVPGLIEKLSAEQPEVRGAAAETLGKIGTEEAIPHLTDLLDDDNTPRWEAKRICDIAADALEAIGTEKALFALGDWRGEQSRQLDLVPLAVNDEHTDNIPLLHLDELNRLSEQQIMLLNFLETIHTEDWHIQQAAARELQAHARSIQGTQDAEVLEQLTHALLAEKTLVRWTATEALAWLGNSKATPALIQLLKDDSWTVRVAAVRALEEITYVDIDVINGLEQALRDENHLMREISAVTIGQLGIGDLVEAVANRLKDDRESFVRRAAAEALGKIGAGNKKAIAALITALKDDDIQVRWSVVEALGKLKAASAVPALSQHLGDTSRLDWEDNSLRDVVVETLRAIGTPEAKQILQDRNALLPEN